MGLDAEIKRKIDQNLDWNIQTNELEYFLKDSKKLENKLWDTKNSLLVSLVLETLKYSWNKKEEIINILLNRVNYMWPQDSLTFLKDFYGALNQEYFQSDRLKALSKEISNLLNESVLQKIKDWWESMLLEYIKIITWRWYKIDDSLKDSTRAWEMLLEMMKGNGMITSVLKDSGEKVKILWYWYKKSNDIVRWFNEMKGWADLIEYMWYNDLNTIPSWKLINDLPIQQQIKVISLDKLQRKIKSQNMSSQELTACVSQSIKEANEIVNQWLRTWLNKSLDKGVFWEKVEKYWFTWTKKQIYEIYQNLNWNWLLNFSDEAVSSAKQLGKIWITIWWSVAAWILAWIALPVSLWVVGGAMVVWAVWWAAAVWLWHIVEWKWYDTKEEMYVWVWSELAINMWLWAIFWGAWAKVISKLSGQFGKEFVEKLALTSKTSSLEAQEIVTWVLRKNGWKITKTWIEEISRSMKISVWEVNSLFNETGSKMATESWRLLVVEGGLGVIDFTSWMWAEWSRQKYILKNNEVDFVDMVKQWWIIFAIAMVASRWKEIKAWLNHLKVNKSSNIDEAIVFLDKNINNPKTPKSAKENLMYARDLLKDQIYQLEQLDVVNVRESLKQWKDSKITNQEFARQRKDSTQKLDIKRRWLERTEKKLRRIEIDELNSKTPRDEKIFHVESLELETNIEILLWKNIQQWGSNASWVFELNNNPNLVAIKKSWWSYEHVWDLPYYYSKLWDLPNLPRVLKVFWKWNDTYIIMERSNWKSLSSMSVEEIWAIPQEHYNQFVELVKKINKVWLCIDPSKTSNFMYDHTIWFIFIDLWAWTNSANHLKTNFVSSLIWNSWNLTSKINEKIDRALSIRIPKWKENLYYSNFSDNIPQSLKSKNPIAWIDTSWEIFYNKTHIEQKYGLVITQENWSTLFDGHPLYKHPKSKEILAHLWVLKQHEVTHRYLELNWISEIRVWEKNYSQETLCMIADGSMRVSAQELEQIQSQISKQIWKDFIFEDIRKLDTKELLLQDSVDYKRFEEAAKTLSLNNVSLNSSFKVLTGNSEYSFVKISENQYKLIWTNSWNPMARYVWQTSIVYIKNWVLYMDWFFKTSQIRDLVHLNLRNNTFRDQFSNISIWNEIMFITNSWSKYTFYKLSDSSYVMKWDSTSKFSNLFWKAWNLTILAEWNFSFQTSDWFGFKSSGIRDLQFIKWNNSSVDTSFYIKHLWPNWINAPMKQWPVWDCYLVATIDALKRNAFSWDLMSKIIQPNMENWVMRWYRVNFRWLNKYVIIDDSAIWEMGINRVSWQLWDIILERAYARLRKHISINWVSEDFADHKWRNFRINKRLIWDKILFTPISDDFNRSGWEKILRSSDTMAINLDWTHVHTGGFQEDVCKYFFSEEDFSSNISYNPNRLQNLKSASLTQDHLVEYWKQQAGWKIVMTATSLFSHKLSLDMLMEIMPNKSKSQIEKMLADLKMWKRNDLYEYIWKDIDWQSIPLVFWHAYSVWTINHNQRWIEVINPHDTAKKRYRISFKNFLVLFSDVQVMTLH